MAEDPPKLSTRIRQSISTYWVLLLTATLTAAATLLLNTFGDRIFDSLVAALGKRLSLQISAVVLCSLGYCVFLLVRRDNRKLLHRRQLYWFSGDPLPFCPRCYDNSEKRVHLFVSPWNNNPRKEEYECHICDHDYIAWDKKDFSPSTDNIRKYQK